MSRLALAAALAVGTAAQAQSVGDFQLQPGTPSPAAGPTDSTVPSPTPQPSARPSPTPPPAVIPRPTPRPSPIPAASPSPRAIPRPAPSPAPVATPAPRATPVAAPSPVAASPIPTESAPAPQPTESAAPSEAAMPAPVVATKEEGFPDWLLWVIVGAGALLLAFGGFLFGRRSGKPAPAAEWPEPEAAAEPTPPPAAPAAPPVVPPTAAPASSPRSRPASPPAAQRPFEMTLETLRMTMAMINASLTYRLTIASRDGTPLGPLRITCDLISAHASLQAAEQLEPDPAQAWLSHDFEALPAGEDLVVNGEVRLPRTEILPVRSGANMLFVPLARFTVQSLEDGVPRTIGASVFVVGEEPEQPGAGLKPFRLNDGTRSYSRIGQREVTIAT